MGHACMHACTAARDAPRCHSPFLTLVGPQGFAYVHFVTVEGLEAACRLDRSEFHGKHILVAPSKPPGGGGGQAGGRGGGRFGGGRGQDAGRGGGRGQEGGRGGGRFGGGRGHDGGRGYDGGRGRGGRGGPKHHTMIDLGDAQPASSVSGGVAPPRGFVPRAAALGGKGQQQGSGQAAQGGAPAADEAPKSNADFRAMFLKK